MNARKLLALFATAVTGATVGLTGSPAQAAALVPLVLRTVDTDGNPIAGVPFYVQSGNGYTTFTDWVTTGADGTVTTDVIPNSTARATLTEAGLTADGSVSVFRGGLLASSINSGYYHPSAPTGTGGGTMTVELPRQVQRVIRVVTEEGQPVAGAAVAPLGLASRPITDSDGTSYRVLVSTQFSDSTDTDGYYRFKTWEQEPDAATGTAVMNNYWSVDGQPTGGRVHFYASVTGRLTQVMPYSALVEPSTEIVLPYTPVIAAPSTSRGPATGTAIVAATLLQPDGSGAHEPIANRTVDVYAEPVGNAAPKLLATAKSAANGRVSVRVNVVRATRVALHLRSMSHVPAVVVAQPRLGDGLAATVTELRAGRQAALPGRSSAGLAVTWRSATPKTCAVISARTVKAVRAGSCRLTASTAGNATYGPISASRAVKISG